MQKSPYISKAACEDRSDAMDLTGCDEGTSLRTAATSSATAASKAVPNKATEGRASQRYAQPDPQQECSGH